MAAAVDRRLLNAGNSVDILKKDIEEAYAFFLKKYRESLFAPFRTNNKNDRMELYLQHMIELLEYYYGKKTIEDHYKYLIELCLKFKNTISSFEDKITFVAAHGQPTLNFSVVPNDCIICFLTPLSYLGYCDDIKSASFSKFLLDPDTPRKFKENPFCLDKLYKESTYKPYETKFEEYKVFFPNQLYCDIELSKYENIDLVGFTDANTDKSKLLSQILAEGHAKGIIFIFACRDLYDKNSINSSNTNLNDIYTNAQLLILYEHMLDILNRSTWYFDRSEYYDECIYFEEPNFNNKNDANIHIKARNIENNRYKVSTNLVKKRTYNNRSLGVKLKKLFIQLGISPKLASILFVSNVSKNLFTEIYRILFNSYPPYNEHLFNRLLKIGTYNDYLVELYILTANGYIESYTHIYPIFVLISCMLYLLITLNISVDIIQTICTVHTIWTNYNMNEMHTITIYLSHCNLTPEHINKLLKLLTEGRQYEIYLNGNNLGLLRKEEQYFTPLKYTKTVNNNTFEKLKTEVLGPDVNNNSLSLQQVAGSRKKLQTHKKPSHSHKKRKYTKKTYTTK